MRLYLDQCLRVDVARLLSVEGHDVLRAAEVGQDRADDALILQTAIAAQRILVTLDGHFGDWAVLPLSEHPGVIRVKVHPTTNDGIARILLPLLRQFSEVDFKNKLIIASTTRVRWIETKQD